MGNAFCFSFPNALMLIVYVLGTNCKLYILLQNGSFKFNVKVFKQVVDIANGS